MLYFLTKCTYSAGRLFPGLFTSHICLVPGNFPFLPKDHLLFHGWLISHFCFNFENIPIHQMNICRLSVTSWLINHFWYNPESFSFLPKEPYSYVGHLFPGWFTSQICFNPEKFSFLSKERLQPVCFVVNFRIDDLQKNFPSRKRNASRSWSKIPRKYFYWHFTMKHFEITCFGNLSFY